MGAVPPKSRRKHWILWSWSDSGCKEPDVGLATQLGTQQEQQVLLTRARALETAPNYMAKYYSHFYINAIIQLYSLLQLKTHM